ncbi:hypothetical protein PENANT_c042G07319 [Penicillium antarcticum]|uniref:Uncharacterized protein n=1 Tax=Penicillium antarcticum TaxID=416450 RepID=A0A1V6PS84_9EURO|nr:hypothetical protein PENANT_c042G07319 [Penicillium antarcticum]
MNSYPTIQAGCRVSYENLGFLVNPGLDKAGTEHDMGWRRYANSKLANVMFMQSLNQRLQEQNHGDRHGPRFLVDSRAHTSQRKIIQIAFKLFAISLPIINIFSYRLRSNKDSARDLIALAVDPKYSSVRGHFDGRMPNAAARISEDEEKREALWNACWEWTGMNEETRPVFQGGALEHVPYRRALLS